MNTYVFKYDDGTCDIFYTENRKELKDIKIKRKPMEIIEFTNMKHKIYNETEFREKMKELNESAHNLRIDLFPYELLGERCLHEYVLTWNEICDEEHRKQREKIPSDSDMEGLNTYVFKYDDGTCDIFYAKDSKELPKKENGKVVMIIEKPKYKIYNETEFRKKMKECNISADELLLELREEYYDWDCCLFEYDKAWYKIIDEEFEKQRIEIENNSQSPVPDEDMIDFLEVWNKPDDENVTYFKGNEIVFLLNEM